MGALPKYKDLYTDNTDSKTDPESHKKEIEQVKEKISQLLNDNEGQKKAAQILELLIRKK